MENIKISLFKNIKESKTPTDTMSFKDVLSSDRYRADIEILRSFPKGSEEFNELKASLPCFTASGTFSERNKKGIIKHNGFMCLDFDNVSNPEELKKKLAGYKFVKYASLSCSGHGVFALIAIEHPYKHSEYFRALKAFFEKEGIPIDSSYGDVSRLRVVSYDEKPVCQFLSSSLSKWDQILPPVILNKPYTPIRKNDADISQRLFLAGLDYINRCQIDITSDRATWLALGSMIKNIFGESGECYFHDISCYHHKYIKAECSKTWQGVKAGNFHIGVFANACKGYGIPPLNELIRS